MIYPKPYSIYLRGDSKSKHEPAWWLRMLDAGSDGSFSQRVMFSSFHLLLFLAANAAVYIPICHHAPPPSCSVKSIWTQADFAELV